MLSVLAAMLMQATTASGPITDPQWESVPLSSGRNAYPVDALAQGVEGTVVVECNVARGGGLADCKVLAEEPTGGPFAQAALSLAAQFRMKAKTQSGTQSAGRSVRLPIAFIMPWGGDDPAKASMFPVYAPVPWLKRPTADDFARVYPERAVKQMIEAQATLHCHVGTDGQFTACTAGDERPAGWEFSEAVLKLAPLFQIDVTKGIGAAAAGRQINVPVQFRLPR
jgi:TonB family protein